MLLIFLDTETTGLNPSKHKTVEIAYKVVDLANNKAIISYDSIISLTPEAWAEADPNSLEVNGFTWEMVLTGKPEHVVAAEITNDFNRLPLGKKEAVFICQNPSFDRAFFSQLISADMQEHYGWPYHWLDLASMYWAVRQLEEPGCVKGMQEQALSKNQIAEHYGLPPEEQPHRAMNGVNHLIACYHAIFIRP